MMMQGLLSSHYRSSPTLRTTMLKIEACVDSGKLQMKEGVRALVLFWGGVG